MKKYLSLPLMLLLVNTSTMHTQETNGESLYQQYCSQCHGTDLQGGNAQSLVDGIWQFGSKRGHIRRNIANGIPHLGMPSYQETLTEDEIRSILRYVENMEEKARPELPPLEREIESIAYKMRTEIFAENLEIPWSIDFADENLAYITERPGRLRIVENGKLKEEAVSGIPEVLHEGQGGLMDVTLHPDYDTNGWIYLSYSHVLKNSGNGERPPAMSRIVRGRVKDNRWIDQEVIYEAPHETYRTTRHHYGCRIVFDKKGYLFFGIGDRGGRPQAQELDRPNGKIHRIYPDGSIPEDNPFYNQEGALKTIFAYGNRNPQGLAIHPETGELWETEHGPMGGDELNLIKAGNNYGWPVITYGLHYNGKKVSDIVRKEGMEQPNLYWKPSTAVCGLDFYKGDLFPKWNNYLLVGALKYEDVKLLKIADDRVIHSEVIFKNFGRVRDVCTGPDGAIYVVLNQPGAVVRMVPVKEKWTE